MITETLIALITRDLQKLYREIDLYDDEVNIWKIEEGIWNSGGNLCLHLIGNLNFHIGKQLGKMDYVRNRDQEFSLKNVPKGELLAKIDETIVLVGNALGKLTREDLDKEYPVKVFDTTTSTEYLLVHLATHFSYHLGQINYHRRLLDK